MVFKTSLDVDLQYSASIHPSAMTDVATLSVVYVMSCYLPIYIVCFQHTIYCTIFMMVQYELVLCFIFCCVINIILIVQSDDFLPTIEKINSTFTYHSETLNRDEYSYKSDATNMKTPDITWTNQGKFNKLEFHLKAHLDDTYVFSRNPSQPSYIRTVKFGIVNATATVIHMKLKNGGEIYIDSYIDTRGYSNLSNRDS